MRVRKAGTEAEGRLCMVGVFWMFAAMTVSGPLSVAGLYKKGRRR